jgi:hypothetical protein
MELFDEEIVTTIKPDGKIEEHSTADHQAEAMQEACGRFLSASRRFQKLNAHPDVATNPRLNCEWWDLLQLVYTQEKRVWRLFVGPQPDMESNKLYARFREILLKDGGLKGSGLKPNA